MVDFYRLEPARQKELAFRRLRTYLRTVVAPFHPAFRKSGVDVARIRSPEDLRRIPIVTKEEVRADPTAFILQPSVPGISLPHATYPLGRMRLLRYLWQAVMNRPQEATARFRRQTLREKVTQRICREWLPIHFHASSGLTGESTLAAYTYHDLAFVLPELAASLMVRPDRPDPAVLYPEWTHRSLSLMPGAPHLAFFQPLFLKLFLGASAFETFGGRVIPTERQIEIFSKGRFHGVAAVPSYLIYWLRRAVEMVEAGQIPPFGEQFLGAAVGAEPISDAMRRRIHELTEKLGAHPKFRIIETYGSTELKWAGAECSEGSTIHLNPRFYFWELLHPKTREPVGAGEPGVLVFSHIDWRGTVFIRYWTGDLIRGGLLHDRCPRCGYTFVRIRGPIARAERDFTKIKGTLVPLQDLVAEIRDTPGVRNCQVILDREENDGRDRMIVRLLLESGSKAEVVSEAVRHNVRNAMEVTPDEIVIEREVEAFEAELFGRTGIKAEYVVERRPVYL
ncbi:MAG: hypothetical protein HY716_01045 [Planctomycetes bacterium]|nr:hypothetical protein [Planctomycetota bacterium]